MSNEENHNDSLERLFRKKSEEYNISYREEDWLNLEKQLEARDMKLYYRRRLRWLAAASILILSLIGYYTIQNHNKINELTEQLNQNEAVQQNEKTANSQENLALAESESTEQAGQREIVEESDHSVLPNENEPSEQSRAASTFLENNSESVAAVSEDETQTNQAESLSWRSLAEATQIIRERSVEPNEFFPNRSVILASASAEAQPVEVKERGSNAGFQHHHSNLANGSTVMLHGPINTLNRFENVENKYPSNSRMAIGLVVSPDLSTAGAVSNFYDPGFKGGVLAEYFFNKNISLISGVTLSNVKYRADGSAYDPPQAWNSGVMPDRTTAVCVVLDIPLNLKANLFNFNRSRIFATAGLSSYIMLNEDYQFWYNQDESGLQTSWSEATGTRHWFSNAGFSIGFEYDLSPNWSLRAEPHIKIPLKGVGWGNVELYSLGSFVSLNYRFNR